MDIGMIYCYRCRFYPIKLGGVEVLNVLGREIGKHDLSTAEIGINRVADIRAISRIRYLLDGTSLTNKSTP